MSGSFDDRRPSSLQTTIVVPTKIDKMETVADIAIFSLEPTDSAGQRWESWVRRFENYIVAKNIQNDKRIKAMLLHYAGEAVFEPSDVVGVIENKTTTSLKRNENSLNTSDRSVTKSMKSSNSDKQSRWLQRLWTSIIHVCNN